MARMLRWITVGVAVVSLGGCATTDGQLERTATFSSASPTGLIVFGVDVQSGFRHPRVTFAQYDPATGKMIPKSALSAEPRQDQVPAGTKIGAALLGGRQTLPTGRSLFMVELPAGDWVFWSVSASITAGMRTYSSNTMFAPGTLSIRALPGKAAYVGEFEINGEIGSDVTMTDLPRRFDKSRGDLASYQNIQVELENVRPEYREIKCERTGKSLCALESAVIVLSPPST